MLQLRPLPTVYVILTETHAHVAHEEAHLKHNPVIHQFKLLGTGEMAQELRALNFLPEDLS